MKVSNQLPRISLVAATVASALAFGAAASNKDLQNQSIERVETNDRTIFIEQPGTIFVAKFEIARSLSAKCQTITLLNSKMLP